MDPEARDVIDLTELQLAQQTAADGRTNFADTKRGAREHTPDLLGDPLNQARLGYEQERGISIRMNARMLADEHRADITGQIYQQMLAESVAAGITGEDEVLTRVELERAQQAPPYGIGTFYARHPWVRAVVGTGVALGTSLAAGADIVPWSVPLGVGVGTASWVGLDGAIQGARDFIQTRFGLRSRPNNLPVLSLHDTEVRLARIQEDRIEKGLTGPSHLEVDIMAHRERLIGQSVEQSLQAANVLPRTWAGDRVALRLREAYDATGESLNQLKQDVLNQNRVGHLARYTIAGILAGVIAVGASYLPLPEKPLEWPTNDDYYAAVIGNGKLSSEYGLAEALIAEYRVPGITNFNPFNPDQKDVTALREYQESNPVENARLIAAINKRLNRHTAQSRVGDLMPHDIQTMQPVDWKKYINIVLGEDKSFLARLRGLTQ